MSDCMSSGTSNWLNDLKHVTSAHGQGTAASASTFDEDSQR